MLRIALRPPGFIEPCQPIGAKSPPTGPGWVHEIKHDGFRIQAHRRHSGVRLLTRNGHNWADRYPAVMAAVAALRITSCLIDGEIAVTDDQGLTVFDALRRGERVKPDAVLFAFDLLELNGEDFRWTPIEVRKDRLARLLARNRSGLILVEHLQGDGGTVYEHACALGCEGIVSKRIGSRYVSGRTDTWIKVKNPAAPAVRREAEEDWGRNRW
jgi:bifunctional non-homologous end joining protein LigD